MVREARFSKDDAGGFEIPEARDSFSDLDDAILDGFSTPGEGKSAERGRRRRRKADRPRPDRRPDRDPPPSADEPSAHRKQRPSPREGRS